LYGVFGEPCRKIFTDARYQVGLVGVVAGERGEQTAPPTVQLFLLPIFLARFGDLRFSRYLRALVLHFSADIQLQHSVGISDG
jgi:hypothetical protein